MHTHSHKHLQKQLSKRYLISRVGLFLLMNLSFILANHSGWTIDSVQKESFLTQRKAFTKEEAYYSGWRWDRAQQLVNEKAITQKRVYDAFLNTPREHFIRKQNIKRAYEDSWMAIGYGVTITDPYTVCIMTETILPEQNMKVLEIGTGTGYQASLLANLTNAVYTIEIIKPLAAETDTIIESLKPEYPHYKNIHSRTADGYYGWKEQAPFDRIIVTCGIDHIPPMLIQQLKPDGIMVIPVGPPGDMVLLKITKQLSKTGQVIVKREALIKVSFVPFTNTQGGIHTQNELQ
jgi:protein-L-isoaspartate(D-aspartate) O-methyltransferase